MNNEHYKEIDPIELMKSQFTEEMLLGFYLGNVIKYASRSHLKDQQASDINKMLDYADRAHKLIVKGGE